MKRPRRKYSRTPGAFYPKRWSVESAIKLTRARMLKVDGLFDEIGAMWGDEDDFFMRSIDELKADVKETVEKLIKGAEDVIEERRQREANEA